MFAVGLIIGILAGVIAANIVFQKSKVGTLRIDTSDPKDVPYIFLELDKDTGDILSRDKVLLRVDPTGYHFPHE